MTKPRRYCVRCGYDSEFRTIQGHHIWPKCAGGPEDGPTADLCNHCHREYHNFFDRGTSEDECRQSFMDFCSTVPSFIIASMMNDPDAGSCSLIQAREAWLMFREVYHEMRVAT